MVGRKKPVLAINYESGFLTIPKNETSFNADISHTASVLGGYQEEAAKRGTVTLLYSSRDPEHNNALALKRLLEDRIAHTKRVAA